MNWMENIRDWCISRQIWWGHRIPVWYCIGDGHCTMHCKEPIVSETVPEKCPHCGSANLRQDEDVLDTWFSSWLWPFATLGWPQKSEDLAYFYPTSSLFTAPEIIFFWVARMIMAGYEFMGDLPFSDVYIHGTVRDTKGRKMSKSLGNAIDPLEIIEEYGADALRFSLIINSGQDIFISKEKFEVGRNFANKMWNASRLILMNTAAVDPSFDLAAAAKTKDLDLPSLWILSRFHATLGKVGAAIEKYQYSEAESLIYDFFWANFCDWYLEIIKDRWSDPVTQNIAFTLLEQSLKMIHPFMPYVTEEIWSQCHAGAGSISRKPWPAGHKQLVNKKAEERMQTLISLISSIRNLRSHWNVKPNEKIQCHLSSKSKDQLSLLQDNETLLKNLMRADLLTIDGRAAETKNSAATIVEDIKAVVPLSGLIDVGRERDRMLGQIEEQKRATKGLDSRLKNREFIKKAPKDIIEKEKERLKSIHEKIRELEQIVSSLEQ